MNSYDQIDSDYISFEQLITPEVGIEEKPNTDKVVEKSRQCPICHVYYKYGNSYWQHVRYVHARFLIQCVICEKCYKRTTMAKHHILHSHKIAWHLCGNYVRKVKRSDWEHKQANENHTEKPNTQLKYFRKKTLHLIKAFNCYYCSQSFSTMNDLFNHVKIHRNELGSDTDESDDIISSGPDEKSPKNPEDLNSANHDNKNDLKLVNSDKLNMIKSEEQDLIKAITPNSLNNKNISTVKAEKLDASPTEESNSMNTERLKPGNIEDIDSIKKENFDSSELNFSKMDENIRRNPELCSTRIGDSNSSCNEKLDSSKNLNPTDSDRLSNPEETVSSYQDESSIINLNNDRSSFSEEEDLNSADSGELSLTNPDELKSSKIDLTPKQDESNSKSPN